MGDERDSGRLPRYADFELSVRRNKARVYFEEVRSPAGDLHGTMRFFTPTALKNHLLALENAILRSGNTNRLVLPAEQQAVRDFGEALFKEAFPEKVRTLYYESLRTAELQGQGLRLKLRIEAPELARLPWEFLFDPRNDQFVGLSIDTPIVRDLGLSQPIEPLLVKPPLRILGMIASPGGTVSLDVEREKRWMNEALEPLRSRGIVSLEWLPGQTWRDLHSALQREPCHVFHFVGHGGFDPRRDEGFILLADNGAPRHLRASDLAVLLHDARALRLVVLNSCDTALSGDRDLFASTASILLRQGEIPAVLAMQFAITDLAAIEFSRAFYEAVAGGLPVDAAVAEARKAVRVAIPDTLEWATPVLHQRSPDGILFDVQQPAAAPTAGSTAPPQADVAVTVTDPSPLATGKNGAATAVGVGAPPGDTAMPQQREAGSREPRSALPGAAPMVVVLLAALAVLVGVLYAAKIGPFAPGPGPTVVSAVLDGFLTDPTIEPNVSLGEGCRNRGWNCDKVSESQYGTPGQLVSVQVRLLGYAGRQCEVRWTMYSVQSEKALPRFVSQPGWPRGLIVPEGPDDQARAQVWVPLPNLEGRFFVRLVLVNDLDAELRSVDTADFDGMP